MGNDMKWYNGVGVINSPAWIGFSCTNRGGGKTYFWKRRAIEQYIEKGCKFIYIRRRDVETKSACRTFFDDMQKVLGDYVGGYRGGKFYLKKSTGDVKEDRKFTDKDIAGLSFSLSTLMNTRSVPLSNVKLIWFDEFLPEDGRFLNPQDLTYEPQILVSFFLSMARDVGTVLDNGAKFVCTGNVSSRYNPYFSYFNLDFSTRDRCYNKDMNVYGELTVIDDVVDAYENSIIGGTLKNTKYGRYALFNEGLHDDERYITKKPVQSSTLFSLWAHDWYTVCITKKHGYLYFRQMYDPQLPRRYRLTYDTPLGMRVPWLDREHEAMVKRYYKSDMILYDSVKTKNMIAGFFERTGGIKVG